MKLFAQTPGVGPRPTRHSQSASYTVLQPKRVNFLPHCLENILTVAYSTYPISYLLQLFTLNYRLRELFKAEIVVESASF